MPDPTKPPLPQSFWSEAGRRVAAALRREVATGGTSGGALVALGLTHRSFAVVHDSVQIEVGGAGTDEAPDGVDDD